MTKHILIHPYAVPYRCLYSRNVENLFMAGRNISVTHVALGTVRVMRTTGMMGEVVGMAASLCKKYDVTPRGVYRSHLEDLKTLMKEGVNTGCSTIRKVWVCVKMYLSLRQAWGQAYFDTHLFNICP